MGAFYPTRGFLVKLPLRTRRQLAVLNAQDWADFKLHWPMRVASFFYELVGGFAFGLALALAAWLWLIDQLVAALGSL